MRLRFGFFCGLLLVSVLAASAAPVSLIETVDLTKQQYYQLGSLGLDVVQKDSSAVQIVIWPGDFEKLDNAGIRYRVIHEDMTAHYQSRYTAKDAATMGGFPTLAEYEVILDDMAVQFPNLATVPFSIGQSYQGRELLVVKISDNPNVDEDEPEVFYNSLIHAREPAGAAALVHFMEWLLTGYGSDPEATYVVDNREMFFLVVSNPDGYYYNQSIAPNGGGMWRKNLRYNGAGDGYGVDLNRNYGYQWGYDNIGSSPYPSEETYRGTFAFSEPETEAIRDFVVSRNFVIVNNIHCYSNLVLWPYGYASGVYTDRQDFFEILGDSLTQYNNYTPQIGWQLYPTNGDADDWFWGDVISKPRAITVTFEIGSSFDGFWPLPSRIPILSEENLFPNYFLAKIADDPYALLPPERPDVQAPLIAQLDYDVTWQSDDTLNPAVSWDLYEYTGKYSAVDDAEEDYGYWHTEHMEISSIKDHWGFYSWRCIGHHNRTTVLQSVNPYYVEPGDSLRFWLWYDVEPEYDYVYIQASTDGETFFSLAGDLTTDEDPNGLNEGNGITGRSFVWTLAAFDLSAWEGQPLYFRFMYKTDDYNLGEGVYFDDIENIDAWTSEELVGGGLTAQTMSFSKLVPGLFSYRVISTDAQNQQSPQSRLTPVLVQRPFTLGDVSDDGAIDLTDILMIASWVFLGGQPPVVDNRAADITCDGIYDLADILRLALLIYLEPGPVECQ